MSVSGLVLPVLLLLLLLLPLLLLSLYYNAIQGRSECISLRIFTITSYIQARNNLLCQSNERAGAITKFTSSAIHSYLMIKSRVVSSNAEEQASIAWLDGWMDGWMDGIDRPCCASERQDRTRFTFGPAFFAAAANLLPLSPPSPSSPYGNN